MMNQKHVFGYRFLVTNRNVFEGHENTPQFNWKIAKVSSGSDIDLPAWFNIISIPNRIWGEGATPNYYYNYRKKVKTNTWFFGEM